MEKLLAFVRRRLMGVAVLIATRSEDHLQRHCIALGAVAHSNGN